MAKLFWATSEDANSWHGPFESESECRSDACCATCMGIDDESDVAIWVAPIDEETDDDDAFWDAVADRALWRIDDLDDDLIDDGWLDPEEAWPGLRTDRDRILANALRQILGPRPEWRTVDTRKARKVEL